MCEASSIIAGITAVVGAGMSYAGQQQQASEVKRARNEQAAHTAAQKQLAMQQQADELELSKEKKQAIIDESKEVAPNKRTEQIEAETAKAQESNVNAMQEANLLGEDSIKQSGDGDYSETYEQERALKGAQQTEDAIKMARLFGANTATGRAIQNQDLAAVQHRLKQSEIDSKRNSVRSGYDWMFNDLGARKAEKSAVDGSKGAALGAIGGAAMNYGLSNLGGAAGKSAGKQQQLSNSFNNLF